MLHIPNDNQAIRFTDGKKINLNLLKNQIDRRILKITSIINKFEQPLFSQRKELQGVYCQSSCQTSLQDKNIEIDFSQCSNNVLRKIDGNKLHTKTKSNNLKYNKNADQCNDLRLSKTNLLLDYSKQVNKQKLADKNQADKQLKQLDLQLSNIQFDQDISYQEQASQLKSYIRQTLSNRKKISMTQRNSIQAYLQPKNEGQLRMKTHKYSIKHDFIQMTTSNRIMASEECLKRMQNQVKSLTQQKRVYQTDNKVRTNLLKKVQQKLKANIL